MGSGRKVCVWFLANCEVQLCSTLAALSILGVVVVCPIMLDPAIDTLISSFEDGMCQTVYARYLTGLSNCSWTSCREGCTADIYSCWHIIVVYVKGTQVEFDSRQSANGRDDEHRSHLHHATESSSPSSSSSTLAQFPLSSPTPRNMSGALQAVPTSPDKLENGSNTNHKRKWILPPSHNFELYEYNNSFIRNIDANLQLMMGQIHTNLEIESLGGSLINVTETKLMMGIGALLPNPQGCVYPSEILCSEFRTKYGQVGGEVFPCYLSRTNSTMVVTRVDIAGAVRNIIYSFLPLIAASGVFTYLFYRVGLIGKKRRRRRKEQTDEESGERDADSDGGTPQKQSSDAKAAALANGVPPVVKKKLRKKFLPNRDSSKKRRKGKIFNKNKLLTLKTQLSVKSPSSSRRTPSMSMGASASDSIGTPYVNNNRNSVQLV